MMNFFFHAFVGHLYFFFCKVLIQTFAHLKTGLFLLLSFKNSLYALNIKFFVWYLYYKYFLPFYGLVFEEQIFFILMRFSFSVMVCAFVLMLRNFCLLHWLSRFSPLFSFRSLIILAFTFRTMIHFNLCVVWGRDWGPFFKCRNFVALSRFILAVHIYYFVKCMFKSCLFKKMGCYLLIEF